MSYQRIFIKAVADILLLGDWERQAMAERVYWLLQSKPVWVLPLVDEIYANFKPNLPYVTDKQISAFIGIHPLFVDSWRRPQMLT